MTKKKNNAKTKRPSLGPMRTQEENEARIEELHKLEGFDNQLQSMPVSGANRISGEVSSKQEPYMSKGGRELLPKDLNPAMISAWLSSATVKDIEAVAYSIPPKRKPILGAKFSDAAKRQHWKDYLGLDLGRLTGNRAITKVNKWLEANEGSFEDVDTETKDEVAKCLRDIRDEFHGGFVKARTGSRKSSSKVLLKTDFDRHNKRRYKLVDDNGRQIRSQGLPGIRIVSAEKQVVTP